jgi:CheY-like chemotaxis protein
VTPIKNVLLADTAEGIAEVSHALGENAELTCCTSAAEARSLLLTRHFNLILCGMHFDECQMFDFLRYCKANPNTSSIPFLCLRSLQGALDDAVCKSIDLASIALGAERFVDLVSWQIRYGDENAAEKLQLLVKQVASGNPAITDFGSPQTEAAQHWNGTSKHWRQRRNPGPDVNSAKIAFLFLRKP